MHKKNEKQNWIKMRAGHGPTLSRVVVKHIVSIAWSSVLVFVILYLKGHNQLNWSDDFLFIRKKFDWSYETITSTGCLNDLRKRPCVSLAVFFQKQNNVSFFDVWRSGAPLWSLLECWQIAGLPLLPKLSLHLLKVLDPLGRRKVHSCCCYLLQRSATEKLCGSDDAVCIVAANHSKGAAVDNSFNPCQKCCQLLLLQSCSSCYFPQRSLDGTHNALPESTMPGCVRWDEVPFHLWQHLGCGLEGGTVVWVDLGWDPSPCCKPIEGKKKVFLV